MRLTEFADPAAYDLTADDAAASYKHHRVVQPDGSTDKPGQLSARHGKSLPPISATNFFDAL
jgi:hypothetical protein